MSTLTPVLEGFLSKHQLAAELNKSTRTLDRWHLERIGPPRLKLGKSVFYKADSVRTWFEAQERPAGGRGGKPWQPHRRRG